MPRLPRPERRYGKAFIIMPDGCEIEMTPLEVSIQLKAWADVAGGLWTYHETTRSSDSEIIKEKIT